MPALHRYAFTNRALTGLLILSEADRRAVITAVESLLHDPEGAAATVVFDWDGYRVFGIRTAKMVIGYVVDPLSGHVTVTLVRPRREY